MKRGLIQGAYNFLVVGHIPIKVFLLVNCFFDAAHTSIRKFVKGQANFH